jgi:DNA-binding NarL/FixJ family response regulator
VLHLGLSTITFHKQNLMRVLGIESEAALTQYVVLVRAGEGTLPPRSSET